MFRGVLHAEDSGSAAQQDLRTPQRTDERRYDGVAVDASLSWPLREAAMQSGTGAAAHAEGAVLWQWQPSPYACV